MRKYLQRLTVSAVIVFATETQKPAYRQAGTELKPYHTFTFLITYYLFLISHFPQTLSHTWNE